MGVLNDIVKAFGKNNKAETKSISDWVQNSDYKLMGIDLGKYDYDTALSELSKIEKYNVWLAASIRAIVSNTIKPALKVWNAKTQTDIENYELLRPVLEPNPYMSYADMIKFVAYSLLRYGNAYLIKIRAGNRIIGLVPLKSDQVEPKWNETKTDIYYEYNSGKDIRNIDKKEIIHIKDNDYGDSYLKGQSIIEHLLFTLTGNNYADRFNIASFQNGGLTKHVLKTTQNVNAQDAEIVANAWKSAYGGADKAGKIAVLKNFDVQSIGQSNADMGFEALKRVTREEIIALMKVPNVELSLQTQNYATANIERKIFWETRLVPFMDNIAYGLSKGILQDGKPSDIEYYYDYSNIEALQDDINKKLQTAQQMIYLGYSLQEASEYLGLPTPETQTIVTPDTTQTPKTLSGAPANPKSFNVGKDTIVKVYRDHLKNSFIKAHFQQESKIKTIVEKFFFAQRNIILDEIKDIYSKKNLGDVVAQILKFIQDKIIEWQDLFKTKVSYGFNEISETMVKDFIKEFNIPYRKNLQELVIIGNHGNKVTEIQNTVSSGYETRLKKILSDAYAQGLNINELRDKIEADTKEYFKGVTTYRAATIARTETTSVANDLILNQYKENGIEYKEWLTSEDERVRSFANGADFDHVAMDGKKVSVDEQFEIPGKSGMEMIDYPADMTKGSAGNVINCRCSIIPD